MGLLIRPALCLLPCLLSDLLLRCALGVRLTVLLGRGLGRRRLRLRLCPFMGVGIACPPSSLALCLPLSGRLLPLGEGNILVVQSVDPILLVLLELGILGELQQQEQNPHRPKDAKGDDNKRPWDTGVITVAAFALISRIIRHGILLCQYKVQEKTLSVYYKKRKVQNNFL